MNQKLRIGTFYTVPFAYPSMNNSVEPNTPWIGYCLDTIQQLSNEMLFEYELETAMEPGKRLPNGSWNGLIGQLASAKLDMIIGPLVPEPHMEEVIDFVTPFYTFVGLSIVVLRPRTTYNLFHFITALKPEVWATMIGGVLITAILIWIIERLSPSSATNSEQHHNLRKFTLKESLWFTATSLTQQGGGETPRPFASRVLVTAYWLFSLLMLAAFMANLAALQTLMNLQYPIKSFEELVSQSRINYTVIQGSTAHKYIVTMAKAEQTIYNMWVNHIIDPSVKDKFSEWEYPVKERYRRILQHVMATGIQIDTETAYEKVLNGQIALIHDDYDIRYKASRDCRLKEIGDTFSPRPFYVALQQGSYLTRNLTSILVELMGRKYFENLMNKYTERKKEDGLCPSDNLPLGITVNSLSGIFVSTLIGIGVGLIVLVSEVCQRKNVKSRQASKAKAMKFSGKTQDGIIKCTLKKNYNEDSHSTIYPSSPFWLE